jgi:multicomponent Na+:H+ antiporter subunit E
VTVVFAEGSVAAMATAPQKSSAAGPAPPGSFLLLEIVVLAALWMLFSGKFDPLHLSYGALSILLTVLLTRHVIRARSRSEENAFLARVRWGRALAYPFWLLWQIVLANIEVARVILGPRSMLDPKIVCFEFPLDDAIPRVTLGNSITITPGTFTLRIQGRRFLVHAIDDATARGLVDGGMQRRVAAVFGHDMAEPSAVELRDHFNEQDRGADA